MALNGKLRAAYCSLPLPKPGVRVGWSLISTIVTKRSLYIDPKSTIFRRIDIRPRPVIKNKSLHPNSIHPSGIRNIFIQTESTPNADVCINLTIFFGSLISVGIEIPTKSVHITSRLDIAIPRIFIAKIYYFRSAPFTPCRAVVKHRWNYFRVLWLRLHHSN